MSARPRHHDRRGLNRLRLRHTNARVPSGALATVWRSPEEALFAYTKAGCVEAMRELLSKNTAACARHLSEALVIAETEFRCARPEDEHGYITMMEALLEAGAPASALLPDMADVLPTLQARAMDAALPHAGAPSQTTRI